MDIKETEEPVVEDSLAICPYNPEHKLQRHRMPSHIVRCRAKYRGPALVGCPFNAMHQIPAHQLMQHLVACEDSLKNRQNLSMVSSAFASSPFQF